MISLIALWLPIVVAAVIVFVASAIIHMGPFWHRSDYPKMKNEDQVMDALRPLNVPPGDYFMPRACDAREMRDPAFLEKAKRGPVVLMTVMPSGSLSMTGNLVNWFIFCLVVSLFAGYVASATLPTGTDYLKVFQVVGATAFIGYALGLWQMSIWYKRALSLTIKYTVDGLIYGLLTAGTFGWLWPR
jgi:hypothetical protein